MARITLLASLLIAFATLPARAQSTYSDPPLPGDDAEAWEAPGDPDEDVLPGDEDEDVEEEDVPGAAAGPADEEEARAFEAYLRELEAAQDGEAEAPETEIAEDSEAPAPAAPARVTEAPRQAESHIFVAQNPYFSAFMDVGTYGRSGNQATLVDAGLRFEGERGGLLITFGGRVQDRVIGGTVGTASYGVFALEPTYAVIANENFRWRIRGGWSAAGNDRVSMSGISLGTSMIIHIAGPLDVEVDVHVTPFPFLRADAKVAAALHFGFVSLRLGWAGSDINDKGLGLGSGSPIRTTYSGMYLGAGLHF